MRRGFYVQFDSQIYIFILYLIILSIYTLYGYKNSFKRTLDEVGIYALSKVPLKTGRIPNLVYCNVDGEVGQSRDKRHSPWEHRIHQIAYIQSQDLARTFFKGSEIL